MVTVCSWEGGEVNWWSQQLPSPVCPHTKLSWPAAGGCRGRVTAFQTTAATPADHSRVENTIQSPLYLGPLQLFRCEDIWWLALFLKKIQIPNHTTLAIVCWLSCVTGQDAPLWAGRGDLDTDLAIVAGTGETGDRRQGPGAAASVVWWPHQRQVSPRHLPRTRHTHEHTNTHEVAGQLFAETLTRWSLVTANTF